MWIIGASCSIGFSLIEYHLAHGYQVLASTRTEGKLANLLVNEALILIPYDVIDEAQAD